MKNITAGPPHILLVDDSPDQLRLLVAILSNSAYRVTVAFDGQQGYMRAVAMMPDLILMDVRMPNRDGFTVARMLKANPTTEHIPILFLSSAHEPSERLTGLRTGAVDYITKPFQSEEVLERVRIHLQLAQKRGVSTAAADTPTLEAVSGNPGWSSAAVAGQVMQRTAARIILDRLEDPPKSAELAAMLGVSERHLNAVFESCSGMSVFEYIRSERMRKAALLLSQTTLHISQIALEVGYSSAANFSTEFRKFWNKTPSAFRRAPSDQVAYAGAQGAASARLKVA